VIDVSGLTKHYGSYVAVENVSFRVAPGEIVGFLGPNGAGKSTTLRMLAGYLGPTAGTVRLAGFDMAEEPVRAKQQLGYMPESGALYPEMRVVEYLRHRAALKGLERGARSEAVARCMEQARIADVALVRIGELSKGYRQRVALADALVADPPVLVLDEPTAGMDPNQIRDVRDLLRSVAPKKAVLLSTHILGEVDAVCTRVIVLAKGRVVAEGPLEELTRRRGARSLVVRVRGEEDAIRAAATRFSDAASFTVELAVAPGERKLSVQWREAEGGARADELTERLVAALVGAQLGVRAVSEVGAGEGADLEEAFAALTKGGDA
jgi:ABC-2 type transport system ATP-binding protein